MYIWYTSHHRWPSAAILTANKIVIFSNKHLTKICKESSNHPVSGKWREREIPGALYKLKKPGKSAV